MKRPQVLPYMLAGAAGAAMVSLVPVLVSPSKADTKLLPFQGRLTDSTGVPIGDGARVVEFKMYDAPTGGNVKWAGEVHKLSVNGGLVNTMLGSKASLGSVDFGTSVYLQITIDANADGQITAADPPLLPRQSVVPAVYAAMAGQMQYVIPASGGNPAKVDSKGWDAVFDNGNPDTGKISGAKLAADSITASQLAPDAVTPAKMQAGAALANLKASGYGGVGAGGIVFSATSDNAALVAAGFQKLGVGQPLGEGWTREALGPLSGRDAPAMVATGPPQNKIIIWGGSSNAGRLNDGAVYDTSTRQWTPMSNANAPAKRTDPGHVWTGTEMIVWGGIGDGVELDSGAVYTLASDTWQALPPSPIGPRQTPMVWADRPGTTNDEAFIWGGRRTGANPVPQSDGARLKKVSGVWTWTLIPAGLPNAPAGRTNPGMVWTGSEVVIWGGLNATNYIGDGARYNPDNPLNPWTTMSAVGAPSARSGSSSAMRMVGTEIVVWGGEGTPGGAYTLLNDGAIYSPVLNSWRPMASSGAPSARESHTSVWTGQDLLVFFGNNGANTAGWSTAARYTPSSDSWAEIAVPAGMPGRYGHRTVWNGDGAFTFGGHDPAGNHSNEFSSYIPPRTLYFFQKL